MLSTKQFIGRKKELEKLRVLHRRVSPSLVVIKGRRRIGKSQLIQEFSDLNPEYKLWSFSGLAPDIGITAQSQRNHFASQLATYLKCPPLTFEDWSNAFDHLSLHVKERDILLFDEISWMGIDDPTFVPKLKAWWDKQSIPILTVFCGSVSTWIEKNILKSTAFFGRINQVFTLKPLSIPQGAELLKSVGFQGSPHEVYKLLAILGGIPWYLEQVTSGYGADTIIKELCFEEDSLLATEFHRIFHDLFNGKGASYKKILRSLKDGMKTLAEIRSAIEFPHSGTLSKMMEQLSTAGFVTKQRLWSFKTGKSLKKSLYRIYDPYIRFYLKVIEPYHPTLDLMSFRFQEAPVPYFPGFDAHMGLQLESLLLQNRPLLLQSMGISVFDIISDGPYRQFQTTRGKGCQVDYLVQTSAKNLYICEFKFKRGEVGQEVIEEMERKIQALKIPRGYAAVPVLFHLGGASPSVETSGYFYRVVDIANYLT